MKGSAMDASTSEERAGTTSSGAGAEAAGSRGRLSRWLGGAAGGRTAALLAEQEAELALLREENARLRTRLERGDARTWRERVHAALEGGGGAPTAADDAAELLSECRLLHAALLDVCDDVERAMRDVRRRLEALAPAPGDPSPSAAPVAEER